MTSNFSTTLGDRPIAAAAIRFLAVVFSTGVHYVVASNLHLFAFPEPLKLRPVGGTVKVVNLTAAEQNRVPNAVKSNPLPIASNPVNPSTASQGSSTLPNSVLPPAISPAPDPAPSPTRSSSRATPSPAVQPSPERSVNPSASPTNSLGLDPNRRLNNYPPGTSGNPSVVQGPQPTTFESGSTTTPTKPSPPTPFVQPPERNPPPTPPSNPSPSSVGNDLVALQKLFRESLQAETGSQDVDIQRDLVLKDAAYPPAPRRDKCDGNSDQYILIGIILGDSSPDGYEEDRDEGYVYRTIFVPARTELSAFAGELGRAAAQNVHKSRSASQKLQEKGKKVLYKFQFRFDPKTCTP
jgi:hypothetical protein